MWVDCKPVDDGYRSLYMMLIHESHVFGIALPLSVILSTFLIYYLFQISWDSRPKSRDDNGYESEI